MRRPADVRTILLILGVFLLVACDTAVPPEETPPDNGFASGVVRYTCGDLPFDPAVLDGPGGAELGQDPLAAVLRDHLATGGPDTEMLPRAGWILAGATAAHAEFVASTPAGGVATVGLDQNGGTWAVGSWGDCVPTAVIDGRSLATWVVDPVAAHPRPADRTFDARVTERSCTGGQPMGNRLLPPAISYGETSVTLIFTAVPLPGGHDCPGNPSTTVTVQLREPLGERVLRDGSVFPPANADPRQP